MKNNKKWKLLWNIGTEHEKMKYFDNLTIKILDDMKNIRQYVLFSYDEFLNGYMIIEDETLNITEKEILYNNFKKYTERY